MMCLVIFKPALFDERRFHVINYSAEMRSSSGIPFLNGIRSIFKCDVYIAEDIADMNETLAAKPESVAYPPWRQFHRKDPNIFIVVNDVTLNIIEKTNAVEGYLYTALAHDKTGVVKAYCPEQYEPHVPLDGKKFGAVIFGYFLKSKMFFIAGFSNDPWIPRKRVPKTVWLKQGKLIPALTPV